MYNKPGCCIAGFDFFFKCIAEIDYVKFYFITKKTN